MGRKTDGSSRQLAIATGARFYVGRECRRGHGDTRYTTTGQCVQCVKDDVARRVESGYYKEFHTKNAARIKLSSKAWREKNREHTAQKARAWTKAHPELRRAISKSYKHRRRAQEKDGISTKALMAWTREQPKVCYWCGIKCARKFHVDHYKPLSKGGLHEEGNLVIACPDCNLRKSAQDPHQFAVSVGRLF